MPILLFFALFLLLDFATLFALGSHLGFLPTLVIMIGTGALGIQLVRREGLATLRHAQARYLQGEINSQELMQGAAYILAGLLLLMPGTLTDILGFLCLLPFSRDLFMRQFLGRASRMGAARRSRRAHFSPRDDSTDEPGHAAQGRHDSAPGAHEDPLEGEYIERHDR